MDLAKVLRPTAVLVEGRSVRGVAAANRSFEVMGAADCETKAARSVVRVHQTGHRSPVR